MTNKHPIEIFMPPNILKAKVGGTIAGLDTAAIARGEQAVEALKGKFETWVEDDVARLSAARDRFAAIADDDTRGDLFRVSHDLKGQGQTFGFPFVARVASSLCRLIEGAPQKEIPIALIDAHVNAIRVIMRDHVKGDADKMATLLSQELESRVNELVAQ